ncbi:metallophosphoesterase family protein [Methanocella arvoryzae]|uniref:Metallophosphoesterase n=1 Tax=Methanocella arvoryzae (strain DSM 22066 / NBRC 105507 / MRE50) TaxID=351160 RepID=Q0W5B7_METAR|nr:metallophosphoesterase family protein [Methanocella arvoryzae]CAJ36426.1 putative metallophosphoesterase [Methanocella arvoryzae MRE50]
MKVLALSDLHGKFFRLDAIIKKSDPVDAIVICGDITHGGPEVSAVRTISELKQLCPTVLFVPGNWDTREVVEGLGRYTDAINLDVSPRIIKNTLFMGIGYSNPTGNNTPSEISEEEIANKLETLFREMPAVDRKVLVTHAPPLDTLDMTPKGAMGSKSLRAALDKFDLIICGHIHKARGKVKDGAWLINPGYAAEGQAAIIDLETFDVVWIDSVI